MVFEMKIFSWLLELFIMFYLENESYILNWNEYIDNMVWKILKNERVGLGYEVI